MPNRRTEILAPVGSHEMLQAAIENGADSVYFGVQTFNARMRANNFQTGELPGIMKTLHRRGMKGYLTVNVLIFENELEDAGRLLLEASRAGVDAIIVQDLGLARLARRLTPDLPVHASTQMTITSGESISALEMLGVDCERVVLARELHTDEIARIAGATGVELEVFIHGALCVAYSGQCLTSEALGGRSANRGECAQACRLPYDLMVDGAKKDVEGLQYLVSPKDLAGYGDVARLVELGISGLKIEGRLKSPEYVAATVQAYRQAVDNAAVPGTPAITGPALEKLENTFSRGFTGGYLQENNHQRVVEGHSSSKLGPYIGKVIRAADGGVWVKHERPLKAGDGVLIEDGGAGQGGRIFEVRTRPDSRALLLFGRGQLEFARIRAGSLVWKTSDPHIERELRQSFQGETIRHQRPIDLEVRARRGEPLLLIAHDAASKTAQLTDVEPVETAQNRPLSEAVLREQLGRLGGTPFVLKSLNYQSDGAVMVPLSRLNALRRRMVEMLLEQRGTRNKIRVEHLEVLAGIPRKRNEEPVLSGVHDVKLSVLCRSLQQVEAANCLPVDTIYTDFEDQRLNEQARRLIRDKTFAPATLRIMKPGEDAMLRKAVSASPDAILVRNLAAWKVLCSSGLDVTYIGDYSLNVANSLSASLLMQAGFSRLTPSYDLNYEQLDNLLSAGISNWFEVTIHQRVPMFHMEHCVFCRFLSTGTNASDCGRPCEKHEVRLKDRLGFEHPLKADYGCRNTLYNAVPQSASEYLPGLLARGIRRFRIDLLGETAAETGQLIELYRRALQGEIEPQSVWQTLRASSKLGVTRGSLDHAEIGSSSALHQLPRRQTRAGTERRL